MINHDRDRLDKRSAILEELRMRFGSDRTGEFGDMDGLGLLRILLRRHPGGGEEDGFSDELGEELSEEDLRLIRGSRRKKASDESAGGQDVNAGSASLALDGQAAAADGMTFGAFIEEIPRMRENLAGWISGVEVDYLPSSSTRDELNALYAKGEYRLKILKVMVSETQKELEKLTIAIRAREAEGAD